MKTKILYPLNAILCGFMLVTGLEIVAVIIIAMGQYVLGASITPMRFYADIGGDVWFVMFADIAPVLVLSVVSYYFHRRYSWNFVLGASFCLVSISFLILSLLLLAGWYLDMDSVLQFLSKEEGIEDMSLSLPLQTSFPALFYGLISGLIGIFCFKSLRAILAALGAAAFMSLSAAAWAGANNITAYCLVNGHWEGSPAHDRIIDYLENSDDSQKIIPGMIYVTHLYLDGPFVNGKGCYTSDDKTRYTLLKKYIFYYPEIAEMQPRTQDIIADKANENDVPAMLLLAYMYTHGEGLEKDQARADLWWNKAQAVSSFSEEEIIRFLQK